MKKWNPILLSLENEKQREGVKRNARWKKIGLSCFEKKKINEESNFRFLLAVTTVWNRH